MKKITYTCDRCGEEIRGEHCRVRLAAISADPADQDAEEKLFLPSHPEVNALDFCSDCCDLLAGLILKQCGNGTKHAAPKTRTKKTAPEKVATSQPKEPAAPKGGSRRKLDAGKIRALRLAGWSVKDIAGEMHCSDKAVFYILDKLGMPASQGIPAGEEKAPEPKPTEQSTTD